MGLEGGGDELENYTHTVLDSTMIWWITMSPVLQQMLLMTPLVFLAIQGMDDFISSVVVSISATTLLINAT